MRGLLEIRVAGFGGQGVILLAQIIGKSVALHGGGFATMTQNFGPEARGGASSAQLVLSGEPVLYPYITQPDVLIAMSQEAYEKFAPELRQGGTLIVEEDLVRLTGAHDGIRIHGIPATRLAEELGKKMVLNVVMAGYFAAVTGAVDTEALKKAVKESVPGAALELNMRAFECGFQYGLQKRASVEVAAEEPVVELLES